MSDNRRTMHSVSGNDQGTEALTPALVASAVASTVVSTATPEEGELDAPECEVTCRSNDTN